MAKNVLGYTELAAVVSRHFNEQAVNNITVDEPFAACHPNTVSATVAARCRIPAIQLEINTRLLMRGYDDYCFVRVLDALRGLAVYLNSEQAGDIAL